MQYNEQRILTTNAILRITAIAWLAGKLVCYKLWLADRLFPLVPVVDAFAAVPSWVHMVMYGASLCLLPALIIWPGNKRLPWLLLACELCSCLPDQNRWQPWEYQYLLTLLITMLNTNKPANAFKALAFMITFMYIYSAINKFTPGFLASTWDALILRGFLKLPLAIIHHRYIYHSGYLLSAIELLSGIGLLFHRTRRKAAIVLIAMHIFILLMFSFTGLRRNISIWPWNVAMIAYLYVFFYRESVAAFDVQALFNKRNVMVAVCWGILPALCFFGLWDNYLSANLYSGRQPYMLICISHPQAAPALATYTEPDNSDICHGQRMINVTKWAYRELNAPPAPQFRVFRKIKAVFLQRYPGAASKFIAYPHATWRGHRPKDIEQEL